MVYMLVFGARGKMPRSEEIQLLFMPIVHNTRSIPQMMQTNWNVMVSLKSRTNGTKHDDQSKEPHEGSSVDQSCRSARASARCQKCETQC